MSWYVIVDGELVPEERATIHVSDLGLRRGFGAFEFFRLVGATPLFLDDHLERLERSRRLIGLEGRWTSDDIRGQVRRLIVANDLRDAGVQIIVTGGRSPDAFTPGEPTLVICPIAATMASAEQLAAGVKVITHRNVRELAEAKTIDYVIAVQQIPRMHAAGAMEVLYHDGAQMLEGARSGLAIVTGDGVLVTAAEGVLESVTRRHVLTVAAKLMPVERRPMPLAEFDAASEVILLGTTRGVLPIVQVDDRIVGTGRPGPHTLRLAEAFAAHVADEVALARS